MCVCRARGEALHRAPALLRWRQRTYSLMQPEDLLPKDMSGSKLAELMCLQEDRLLQGLRERFWRLNTLQYLMH